MYPSDNYYNKKGKYLGSDGKGTTVRLMDIDVLQDELSFNTFMKVSKVGDVDVVKLREGISRKITFKNERQKYQNMYNDSKDDAERSTVIILDVENAEIRTLGLEIGEVGGNSSKTYHTGTRFGNRIVLGNVHTHQQEEKWMADGFSDLAIFDAQYREPTSDGESAFRHKDNIIALGSMVSIIIRQMGKKQVKIIWEQGEVLNQVNLILVNMLYKNKVNSIIKNRRLNTVFYMVDIQTCCLTYTATFVCISKPLNLT